MIRYASALDQLEAAVEAEAPGWAARAETRTSILRDLKAYAEEYVDAAGEKKKLSAFWGEVKQVYMRRQYKKCVYCETKLEGARFATVQWDLEHFRPKGNVRRWPPKKSAESYGFEPGEDWPDGYYLLAYHLRNYAAACKTCNSPFKSDYFPVTAARVGSMPHPEDYQAEEPLLLYPLGASDADPETLITFFGAEARPRSPEPGEPGHNPSQWRRGRVLINFFGLNRDGLVYNRAWWLLNAVWPNFKLAELGDADGVKNVERARSERAPFTACSRRFLELCEEDRPEAAGLIPVLEEIISRMDD